MTRPVIQCVKRTLTAAITTAILLGPTPGEAYLKFGIQIGDRQVPLKWAKTPVRIFLNDRTVPDMTPAAFQAAVSRAFTSWQAVPTVSISYQILGFTSAEPFQDDGVSTIGFANRPDLDRVLGATTFLVDLSTGELLESDILLNSAFRWSVAATGETGRFDVESIALHEIGHLSGLGHSALGETEVLSTGGRRVLASEAVMFPIAFAAGSIVGRTLRADDIAGISDLYPDNEVQSKTGSISGQVITNGGGVFGAHVVAFDLAAGSLVASFTLDDQGRFVIAGLAPGPHVLRVEPLDDIDIDSVFEAGEPVDVDFRVSFLDRLVVVPGGGDAAGVEIRVTAK
jgi:matrixin